MTAETLKELCLCGETTKVQFKEDPVSQKEVAKEMIAFANTTPKVVSFCLVWKTKLALSRGCHTNKYNKQAANLAMPPTSK